MNLGVKPNLRTKPKKKKNKKKKTTKKKQKKKQTKKKKLTILVDFYDLSLDYIMSKDHRLLPDALCIYAYPTRE